MNKTTKFVQYTHTGGLRVVVLAANERRAPPHVVGRGSSRPTLSQVGGCGFQTSWSLRAYSELRDACALFPVENRPTAHGVHARSRTWRGCLRGQRATRTTPRRWPRLFFTDTAPGQRLWLGNFEVAAFNPRGARRARASSRGEQADGPKSMRALADFARLSLQETRDSLYHTPLAEALLHRHRTRSGAAASDCHGHRIWLPCRATRARFALWIIGRRPTEHARAGGLGVVFFAANAPRRAHPVPLAEALLHQHCARSAAAAL